MKHKKDEGLGSKQDAARKRKCAGIGRAVLESGVTWSAPRTMDELAAAVAYLGATEKGSDTDPNRLRGERIGLVARKGAEMLLWAAGQDNQFGRMVARAVAKVTSDERTTHLNPADKPDSNTKDSQ